ncbi:MAG: hypothetical protein MJ061_02625, partial [Mailhella sp.]|nr:hypothetical protein [Mailhella sp.]
MRRILADLLAIAVCFFMYAAASAAEARVLVLPFAVNGPAGSAQLAKDIPVLVGSELGKRGFRAVPAAAPSRGAETSASARTKALSAHARYAVWGTLNQAGEGFSLDMQCVEASSGGARPYHMEGASLLELQPVIGTLVGQVAAGLESSAGAPIAAAA